MEYSILAIGFSDELFSYLKQSVAQYKLHFVASSTIQGANRLVYGRGFRSSLAVVHQAHPRHLVADFQFTPPYRHKDHG